MKLRVRLFAGCRRSQLRPARNLFLRSDVTDERPARMKHLSDQELMRIVQAGDLAPAAEIYDRYSDPIYNFAYRFLRNSETAEDAVQEVLMKVIKHAGQYKSDAKFSTWVFTITANWCRDHMRRHENKRKEPEAVLQSLHASPEDSPERAAERRENEDRIKKALSVLNDEQRGAILLSRYQGLSYGEIAQIYGCSEGAIKTRVFRAMEILKKSLSTETPEGPQCLTAMP
jgi:RNA polymerase sigma factor (sigma-70 family)